MTAPAQRIIADVRQVITKEKSRASTKVPSVTSPRPSPRGLSESEGARGPGTRTERILRSPVFLDSGLAPSARPGMTIEVIIRSLITDRSACR
jgi:hypothetical protein